MLTYTAGKAPVPLTSQSTIFSEARRRNMNVGLVGWYLPYCRLIADCTECVWSSAIGFSGREETEHPSVLRSMGATNILSARSRQPLTHAARDAAARQFMSPAKDGRVTERFELLHFAAWTPNA